MGQGRIAVVGQDLSFGAFSLADAKLFESGRIFSVVTWGDYGTALQVSLCPFCFLQQFAHLPQGEPGPAPAIVDTLGGRIALGAGCGERGGAEPSVCSLFKTASAVAVIGTMSRSWRTASAREVSG
jgi:hypothetical protein